MPQGEIDRRNGGVLVYNSASLLNLFLKYIDNDISGSSVPKYSNSQKNKAIGSINQDRSIL